MKESSLVIHVYLFLLIIHEEKKKLILNKIFSLEILKNFKSKKFKRIKIKFSEKNIVFFFF